MTLERELTIAKQAVERACKLCATAQPNLASSETHSKEDKSPVTVADYGAQALVLKSLWDAFPDDPAVGEEDTDDLGNPENELLLSRIVDQFQKIDPSMDKAEILSSISRGGAQGGPSGRFWTLDPIDGTKGFLRGDQYAVALALIIDGNVALGVLGCPNLPIGDEKGCLLFAAKGQGAFQSPLSDLSQQAEIRTDSIVDPSQAVFCESVEPGHTLHDQSAKIASLLGSLSEPFRMDSQCKYAAVSRGQASIYLRLPTRPGYEEKIWDHAAGVAILEEAGGRVCDTFGKPLDFSLGRTLRENKGVVATSAGVFDAVTKAVVDSI